MTLTYNIQGISVVGELLREVKSRLLVQFNGDPVEVRIYNGELTTVNGQEKLVNMCQRGPQVLVAFDHMEVEGISSARKQGSILIYAGIYVAVNTFAEEYEVGEVEQNIFDAHTVLHRAQSQLLSEEIPVFTGHVDGSYIDGKPTFEQVDTALNDINLLVLRVPFMVKASVDYSSMAV
jgi:hypothetical protein